MSDCLGCWCDDRSLEPCSWPCNLMRDHRRLRGAAQALMGSWITGSGTADQAPLYEMLDAALGNKEQMGS